MEVIVIAKSHLNIRFHNPNPPDTTASYIKNLLVEVIKKKIEKVLQEELFREQESKDRSRYIV